MPTDSDARFERMLGQPHRRHNPLLDEWVLVSAGRDQRPWQGAVEAAPAGAGRPAYDTTCYLCPGNERVGGARNPAYTGTFAFTNDFAALRPDVPQVDFSEGLLRAETEAGTCRVLCFSPRHDLELALMDPASLRAVVDLWADQTAELGERYRWVQVFENRGQAMGASNPHPHGQVWAGSALPTDPAREDVAQRRHLERSGRRLLLDYVDQEAGGPRVVVENEDWIGLVPFWAVWPFETMLVARQPVGRLQDLSDGARDGLVRGLSELLVRYDNLFQHPFPYSMGWHQAPFGTGSVDHWQLHAHLFPPMLRSATVRKFMVGYELLAEAQRDVTPEEAAARLQALSARHYRKDDADA
jgi:UDPglucose--hexose-1-phosphate uridylyltransferase